MKELVLIICLVCGCASSVVEQPEPVVVAELKAVTVHVTKPTLTEMYRTEQQRGQTKLKKKQEAAIQALKEGTFYSITPATREARIDECAWNLLDIEAKKRLVKFFSVYFELYHDDVDGTATIRSSRSDEKLGSAEFIGIPRIYK